LPFLFSEASPNTTLAPYDVFRRPKQQQQQHRNPILQQTKSEYKNIMTDRSTTSCFPILKNSVILQIMEEVEIPLTEAELVEPGRCKERVREVFARLVSMYM
jgi:hypothetical protein